MGESKTAAVSLDRSQTLQSYVSLSMQSSNPMLAWVPLAERDQNLPWESKKWDGLIYPYDFISLFALPYSFLSAIRECLTGLHLRQPDGWFPVALLGQELKIPTPWHG